MSSPRKRLVPKEISPPPALVVHDDDEKEDNIAHQSDEEPDADAM